MVRQQLSDIVSGLSHEEKGKIQAALDGIAGPAKALDPLDAKLVWGSAGDAVQAQMTEMKIRQIRAD